MGHPLIVQALPEDSRLFARLQDDWKLGTLFAELFNAAGGPYGWAEMEDLNEYLADLAEREPRFGSRAVADRAMADLLACLEEARTAHPGLETRRTFFDKSQWDVEERLVRELSRRGREKANEFVEAILFGADLLTPPGVEGPLGDGLRVVRSDLVAEAARVLREVAPEALFNQEREKSRYLAYRSWRETYLSAAEWGEAIVVGS